MDGVIGYSFPGSGAVVVIFPGKCSREYGNSPLIWMRELAIPLLVLVMGK